MKISAFISLGLLLAISSSACQSAIPTATEPVTSIQATPAPSLEYPVPAQAYPIPSVEYPAPAMEYPFPTGLYPAPGMEYPVPTILYPAPGMEYPVPAVVTPVSGQIPIPSSQPGATPGPITGENITWDQALALISNGEVAQAMQTHNLKIILTLKDGRKLYTVEPVIDAVIAAIKQCGDKCKSIRIATE